jgi:hypothetical protein
MIKYNAVINFFFFGRSKLHVSLLFETYKKRESVRAYLLTSLEKIIRL